MKEIKLSSDAIGREDIDALCEWLRQDPIPRLTKGLLTVEMEDKWANRVGTKHSVYVNSGSSAILLLLAAYEQLLGFKPKVVCPAVSWSTDVSSPMLLGHDVILCDCNMEDLSCNLLELESIFMKSNPDLFISVAPLGLIPNIELIVKLCDYYNVKLIEDNCEAMGSMIGDKMLGCFGDASVFSTYFGHHLSTIEGGLINTDDSQLYNILMAMRSHGWARDISPAAKAEHEEAWGIGGIDSLYTFYYPGFNVRSTDLQAFIGLRMIDRLDEYSKIRNRNFMLYKEGVKDNMLDISQRDNEFVSNFAYPVVNRNRDKIVTALMDKGVEMRTLIAGSIGMQPFWIKKYGERLFRHADLVHAYGFYLPNHQDVTEEDIERIVKIINGRC